MDDRRFDSLARSLAAPQTRRALIGALAAFGAGVLGSRAAVAQVTQVQCGNKICASNPGVCNPGCVCCVYPNGNSRCRPPGTCAPGTAVCPPGQVLDPSGVCVTPTTTTTPAPCGPGYDLVNGTCFRIPIDFNCGASCYAFGSAYSSPNYLCGNSDGQVCSSDAQCPAGQACNGLCWSAC